MPVHPYLADLQYDSTGSGGWLTLGSCTKFKEPEVKRGKSKTGDLKTLVHTYKASWGDPGECAFTIYMSAANYTTLQQLRQLAPDSAQKNFRVIYNNPATPNTGTGMIVTFAGFVTSVGNEEVSDESDNEVMTTGAIQMSGDITITQPT